MSEHATLMSRGGTNKENMCRVGYRVRKLISGPGPGQGLPDVGWIKVLNIFSLI